MFYLMFKKAYDDEGEFAGLFEKFLLWDQDELNNSDEEELQDYFAIPLSEALNLRELKHLVKGNSTIN